MIAFFGTSDFAVEILNNLSFRPDLIITTPDMPRGRRQILEPPPTKKWAAAHQIPVLQPEKLKSDGFISTLNAKRYNLFIVAAYGKIIPKTIFNIPKHGTLNIHPSLLPKYRGPSPLQSQILNEEKDLGISIIQMDEGVDHGPIVAQEKFLPSDWPIGFKQLEKETAAAAAKLLEATLLPYLAGEIVAQKQDDTQATFTKMLKKEDGLIDLAGDSKENYLKYLAYEEWPGTYFFHEGKRFKIKSARFENNLFQPMRVIPEGKKETDWSPK